MLEFGGTELERWLYLLMSRSAENVQEGIGVKKTAEAVIVGGGVMGCSIQHGLAARGMTDTVLLEMNALGSGSTGHSQAILRMHYSNEVTTRMAWESLKVYRGFEEAVGGPSGYVRTGYLLVGGRKDRTALEANVAMQKGIGVSTALATPAEAMELAPSFSIADEEVCAYEPQSGYADPDAVTQTYARRSRELGAQVSLGATVTEVVVEAGRVQGVVTDQGQVSAPTAVIAAGPWSKPLLAKLGVEAPLQTVRHQVIILGRPEPLWGDHAIIGDLVHSLSARPDTGNLTLVGVGEDELAGPEDYEQGVDTSLVEDVSARLARRMPGMSRAQFRGGWSGLFTTTPDWHPILDAVDGVGGLYCAVGFSGHGFKLAPLVGAVMAEMVLDGRATTIDVSMLGLKRFAEDRPMKSRYGMAVLA